MPKYTKFADIPKFTQAASYRVDVEWSSLEEQLRHWDERAHGSPVILDPDFQRGHVWDEAKQVAYVEYILRGGQSSRELQFNCSSWGREYNTPLELVDGKQRLEAVRKFLRDDLVIFGGTRRSDFTDRLRTTWASFRFFVNNLKTRREVLQWYLDLNRGGCVHTDAEIKKVEDLLSLEKHNYKF